MPASEPRSTPLRGRTVVHLAYPDLHTRFELITRFLPRLESVSPRRRWFFVDVPVGLEVVQLHARTDRSVKADLEAWLEACRARRLVTEANFAAEAMVLDPRLFLDGRVPAFYLTAMADSSLRAVALHQNGSTSEADVASEITALYADLIPHHAPRLRALDLYARWLEVIVRPEPAATARPDRSTVRASLVARLAHTQAVRLYGPDYAGGLSREAELVRSVLRQELARRSSARARGT